MPQTDSEIIQQWDTYITDYEEKYQSVKQEAESIINDPTASNERKAQAIRDVQGQGEYLNQLKANKALLDEAYAHGQSLPNVTFNVTGAGMVVKNNQSIIFPVTLNSSPSGLNYDIVSTDFTIFRLTADSSTPWNGNSYSKFNTDGTVYGVGITSTSGNVYYTRSDPKGYVIPGSGGSWLYNNRTLYVCVSIVTESNFNVNNIVTISTSSYMSALLANDSGVPTEPVAPNNNYVATGIKYDYGSETQDPYEDKPWDYYNDNIKDSIANDSDKVYPEGYDPGNPYDPIPEPEEAPDDSGEVPTDQITRNVLGATRFITQYALNYQELATVGLSLWTSWLTINTDVWKNFFLPYAQDFGTLNIGAALDFIISLKVFPFAFTDEMSWIGLGDGVRMGTGHTDFLGGQSRIVRTVLGYLDGGTCEITPYFNDFRDIYNTTIIAYLPYCGTVQLNPAEVMGKTLHLYYYIDFQSGSCTAVIKVVGENTTYNICAKSGQMGFSLPITATNAGQVAAQFISDATKLYGTIGGMGLNIGKTIIGADDKVEMALGITENVGSATGSLIDQGTNLLSRSGIDVPMISGGGGIESFKFPSKAYVQIRRGKYGKPSNYGHCYGYMNDSSGKISDFGNDGKALCKFTGVDTTGLKCNDAERTEILSLLQTGVYV